MTNLLINEQPLQVLPSLACRIGLNHAIFLQQLHWWLGHSKHNQKGKKWVYNTQKDWNKHFPFWSEKTIKRIISDLKKDEWIITDNFNRLSFDRTLWYTINYPKLTEDIASGQNDPMHLPFLDNARDNVTLSEGQTDPMGEDNVTLSDEDNLTLTIPKDNHKITQKKTTKEKGTSPSFLPSDIISYFNEKTGKNFSHKTTETLKLINGRISDGYTFEDFKKVIDIKTEEWLHSEKMNKHLAPKTLFRPSNFETYLNQIPVEQPRTENNSNGSAQRTMLPEVEEAIRLAIGDEEFERTYGNKQGIIKPKNTTPVISSEEAKEMLQKVLNKVSRR